MTVAPPPAPSSEDTPSRDTELELRRSEARFRQFIETAPEAIFVHRRGCFVYANPATARLMGYPPGALVGKSITQVVHPDDLAAVIERTREMLVSGTPAPMGLHRFLRFDGSTAVAETVPLPIEFDGVPSVIVFARDVTERLRLEAALRQADRLVSVGTLAAGVAHEINNPLAYVVSSLAHLAERLPELASELARRGDAATAARLDELDHALADAREGAERVRMIVRDLKTLSGPEDDATGRIDVTTAIESSVHMVWNEIRHRARLVRSYVADPPPVVLANSSRLGQVFLNLLVNASQAIPVGDAERQEIRVGVRVVDGRVEVTIADTGAGIAPENLARVFDPFFTTKPPGEGTGLGLSICHGIVRGMGGEITVTSELGRGTTFRVSLPALVARSSLGAVRRSTRPPAARASERPARRRVLVVDDEAAIGRALTRLLARDGHDVTTVSSGREALARFDAGDAFDVVMCDLMMPELTGIELYERVRATRPELAARFVFMTGGAFTAHAQDFLARVPNLTVEKPFDSAQVRALLAG